MSKQQEAAQNQQQGSSSSKEALPAYSSDILAPPQWQGPPGQLIQWQAPPTITGEGYAVYGDDSQVVQITLPPGASISAQPGSMMHMSEAIKVHTGTGGGCCLAFKRCLGGEHFFRNLYTNQSQQYAAIALAPDFPSKVIPVDLSKSGTLHIGPGLYLAHIGEAKVTFRFVRNCFAGCFGGNGFFLTKTYGTGTVFLTGSGTIMEKVLAPGEILITDSEAIVAFASTVKYGVRGVGCCLPCCCGGEGMFNTKLTGPGLVVLQSMCQPKLHRALNIPSAAAAAGAGAGAAAASNAGG